jgi:hypothetical protein
VDPVKVEHVESADHGSVQEEGPNAVGGGGRAHEGHDRIGAVGTVHANARAADGLDVRRCRDDDRGDRGEDVTAPERAVVDRYDPGMFLPEGAP